MQCGLSASASALDKGSMAFHTMTLHSHLTCSHPYLQDCCFQWFCELELECENTSFLLAGVEMEAMVAASVAALTVYDMCKALDKGISIEHIRLQTKTGGKSGDYSRASRLA